MKNVILSGVGFCLLVCLCFCGYYVYWDTTEVVAAQDEIEDIKSEVIFEQVSEDLDYVDTISEEVKYKSGKTVKKTYVNPWSRYVDFNTLKGRNSDVFAWIFVPGTNIDYYVMKAPKDDTYKYLWHNIYNKKTSWGSIFTTHTAGNTANLTFYGHRMRNRKVAFSNLRAFKSKSYADSRQYAYVYYPEKTQKWRLWAVVEGKQSDPVYEQPYTVNTDRYSQLLNHIDEHKLYNIAAKPADDKEILVLSTCSGSSSGSEQRLYLVYVLDGEV